MTNTIISAIGLGFVAILIAGFQLIDIQKTWHIHNGQMRRRVDGRWEYRAITDADLDDVDDANAW